MEAIPAPIHPDPFFHGIDAIEDKRPEDGVCLNPIIKGIVADLMEVSPDHYSLTPLQKGIHADSINLTLQTIYKAQNGLCINPFRKGISNPSACRSPFDA